MGAVNPLIGTSFPTYEEVDEPNPAATDVLAMTADDSDGTEWIVAALVLGALGVLILFRAAGFQAVIAASAKVGG